MKKIIAIVFSILGLTAIGIASLYFGLQSYQPEAVVTTNNSQSFVETTAPLLPPDTASVESEVNRLRAEAGLVPLFTENEALDRAAEARAKSMCETNRWSHEQAWPVLSQYYSYDFAGENLYNGVVQPNQAEVVANEWRNSPSHYKNIIGDFTEMGVGVYVCDEFQGKKNAVIIVNYFGVPT